MKNTVTKLVTAFLSASVLMISSAAHAFAAYELGDVNNNGFADAVDASLILSEYASSATEKGGSFTTEQRKAADVNHDDHVDAVDASHILAYYAYKSTSGTLDLETYVNDPPATTTTTKAVTTTTTTTTTTAVTTTVTAVSVDYSEDIIGFWELVPDDEDDTDKMGLFFAKDGTGGVYEISSDMFRFDGDDFILSDTVVPSPLFSDDNGKIVINDSKENIIEMERIKSTNGYLGTYHFYGGKLYDILINGFKIDRKSEVNPIYAILDFYENGQSKIVFKNYYSYDLNGNRIELSENENLMVLFNGPGTVKIEGDKMSVTDGNEEVLFTRVKFPSDESLLY